MRCTHSSFLEKQYWNLLLLSLHVTIVGAWILFVVFVCFVDVKDTLLNVVVAMLHLLFAYRVIGPPIRQFRARSVEETALDPDGAGWVSAGDPCKQGGPDVGVAV